MKKILIIGNLGFIGKRLEEYLKDKFEISTYDIKEDKEFDSSQIFNGVDTVIHLGAFTSVGDSMVRTTECLYNNILFFATYADLAKKYGVKHFIYASSSSVYGDDNKPKSFYAASKKMNEMQAEIYSIEYNMTFTGLRFHNVYGKKMRDNQAISIFMKAIKNNKDIVVNGDGLIRRDFTYVDDVCKVIESLINITPSWKHKVFDVGTGTNTTIKNLIYTIIDLVNPSYNGHILYTKEKSYDAKTTLVDLTELSEVIGEANLPTTKLNEGLKKMI